MSEILLVEDSPEFQLLVKKSLGDGQRLTTVGTAAEARRALAEKRFDLVILDITLPDGDGFELCTELRQEAGTADTPILFLTGRNSVTDKVNGFQRGGDDYVVKPFEPLEFRARVEARLRRKAALPSKETLEGHISRGDLKVSVAYQKAFLAENRGDRDLGLTPIEFKLLFYFMRNEGSIVSRQQLLAAVWGNDVHVIDRIIDRHVCSLRQKLSNRASYIETVPRAGYRFSLERNQGRYS